MFNINICHNNMDDVRELTEIARANNIATDYHINETPMTEQDHFKHLNENETYLTEEDWPKVDALLDYLNDKRKNEGYKMANPIQHMEDMKMLMRGKPPAWRCEAGRTFAHHPHRRHACTVLPDVFGNRRLGRRRQRTSSTATS